jgi:hypothetical protein
VQTDRDEINGKITAAAMARDNAVQAAITKFESTVTPLKAQLFQKEREELEGVAARQFLLETADKPDVIGKIANLEGRVTAANEQIDAIKRRAGASSYKAQQLFTQAKAEYMGQRRSDSQALEAEAQSHVDAAEAARAEADALRPGLHELEAQLAKERELLLVP